MRDIAKLRRKLDNMKILETLLADRPDTRWVMSFLTNVSYVVSKIPPMHLGCKETVLPLYLKRDEVLTIFPGLIISACFFASPTSFTVHGAGSSWRHPVVL